MSDKTVGIIGTGNVGATLAFSLANANICKKIILKDIKDDMAKALSLDISQSANIAKSKTIIESTNDKLSNCDIIVITAGIARKPGMSRDDLLLTNAKIMSSAIDECVTCNKNAIYIVVSNPLDVMVYVALKASKLPKNRVIGMAGILDSSRMAHYIQEKLGYGQGEINALVMGGHGDAMVPLVNHATVGGKKLTDLLDNEAINEIINNTKNGGAEIVGLLKTGSAYYAPAYATMLMIKSIIENRRDILPCAVLLDGEYGYSDIVAGVPIKLGKNGVEEIVNLELNQTQKEQFSSSINQVKESIKILDDTLF